MSLQIWSTKADKLKVLTRLAPVLKSYPNLEVNVGVQGTVSEGTTLILGLGNDSASFLSAQGLAPKNRKVSSLRGQVFKYTEIPVLLTYSADIGDIDHGWEVDLLCDTGQAMRLYTEGSLQPQLGNYRWVDDFSELIQYIKDEHAKTGKNVDVSHDKETIGLDPWKLTKIHEPGAYIVTYQFSAKIGTCDAKHFGSAAEEVEALKKGSPFRAQIEWLLTCPYISLKGANLKFDLVWEWVRSGIECTNFKFDTTLVGCLFDEERSNGLDVHTKIYYPRLGGYSDAFDASVDKSRMDLVPKQKLLPYAGGDGDATLGVAASQKRELVKDPKLASFYINILHPGARAFEKIERGGVLVDVKEYAKVAHDMDADLEDKVAKAKKYLGGHLVAKHYDPSKKFGLNLTKASLLIDFLFSPKGLNLKPRMYTAKAKKDGTKTPATSMEHLSMFSDHPDAGPFIELLQDFSKTNKARTTYVGEIGESGWLEYLRSDGRFHPTYWLFAGNKEENEGGTVTGRLSCKNPSFQCMVGETLVITSAGPKRLDWLVETAGSGLKVLTHTGEWKRIAGVYKNGVQPTFRITLASGNVIECTANHPLLTSRGWIRTDGLQQGERVYIVRTQNQGLYESNLLQLDSYEEQVPERNKQGLEELRGQRHNSMSRMAGLRDILKRYGRKAWSRLVHRTKRREWELQQRQLRLGNSKSASAEQDEFNHFGISGEDNDRGGVGDTLRDFSGKAALSAIKGDAYVSSPNEEEIQDRAVFCESTVASITPVGNKDTFDLTIDGSHSFIANGIVVHNTLPKHHPWAKRLRRCLVAPPGYVMMEADYSQGELRVIACVAGCSGMIQVYKEGKDLHTRTAASVSGMTYDQLASMKHTNEYEYGEIRQKGKAGNFGLVYGMSANGFVTYAKKSYGVTMSLEDAEKFRNNFFKEYWELPKYHEAYKAYAHTHGYVRTPLGRIRHLFMINSPVKEIASSAERQAINSPVQGCLSDMMVWSLAIENQLGYTEVCPAFGVVHDAGYSYLPEDNAVEWAKKHKYVMENLPFEKVGWKPQLKFIADTKIGPNMADMKDVE